MGQEITHSHFKKSDFDRYRNKLDAELAWVKNWFNKKNNEQIKHHTPPSLPSVGFELEVCLIDHKGLPASLNDAFLQRLKNTPIYSQASLELAQFNIELNSLVFKLTTNVLQDLEQEFKRLWSACQAVAKELNCKLVMIGSLPSLREDHLKLTNMSPMTRYAALNEQVLRSRKGKAIELDIQGSETLKSIHQDVMLEAVATSFQLHLQMPFSRSVRYYNAAIILSSPIVAVSANSPFLFGKALWCETRIPVFEQAVSVGGFDGAVWRWNRPLISPESPLDEESCAKADSNRKAYHVRLEHLVIPAGPTIVDSIANAALFYGAVTAMANQYNIPEQQLAFVQAKENFYHAAKQGLKAKITWLSGQSI
ncbi:MAG: glutamate--cysteine ligase, partial [gamma proteobacterium symbiont of Bathyaustriella thionipta]|nr:glutamate--cysteine ligase [gamma proteobacterium symbiont of Bathyaustriella thionipta]